MTLIFLKNNELLPILDDDSEDVKTVASALSAMRDAAPGGTATLDLRDCGAAYRFLTAVAAVTPGRWLLTGTERLLRRPIQPLVDCLRAAGADIERCEKGWLVCGKELRAEELSIDCTRSSQFASALLLIGDAIGLKNLHIYPNDVSSMPYIAMTKQMVELFRNGGIPDDEADWSSAAVWYAYLACSCDKRCLFLKGLKENSLQGDEVASEFFGHLGIASHTFPSGISIVSHPRREIPEWELDLRDSPDLAPILAATAVLYPLHLTLRGLQNLNSKESDRLFVLGEMLSQFAPVALFGDHTLMVTGTLRKPASDIPHVLDTHNDHRMAMAAALLSLRYNVSISDFKCIGKSYPAFANYFSQLPVFQK